MADEIFVESNVAAHNTDRKMLELFIIMQSTQSAATARTYRGTVERFATFAHKPMREVTLSDLVEYQQSLSHLALSTQKRMLTTIRSWFAFLSAQPGYLIANPAAAASFKLPKVVESDEVEHILTRDEIERIRDVLRYRNPRNHLIVTFLFVTGLRISECVDAKWCDVFSDLNGNIGLTVIGKGRKRRTVKLPRRLFDAIVRYRQSAGLDAEIGSGDDTPLFINKHGEAITTRYIERFITDAAKLAGVNKNVTPHWFRHSAASHAIHNGANVQQVKDQLGHSSINTTTRYVHTLNRLQNAAADFIEYDDNTLPM